MPDERIYFNGIDATTGDYLQEPVSELELARRILGAQRNLAEERDLKWWNEQYAIRDPNRKPARSVDPRNLASSGWGVIFSKVTPPGVREELAPLLEHRRAQATREHEHYYRDLVYMPGENKAKFLRRLKVEVGPAHPDQLPYYLLIVGDPALIPYRFQYMLDMQYAVGRLSFDDPEDYGRYAASVIAAEGGQSQVRSELTFFSVRHDQDPATERTLEHLVNPLLEDLSQSHDHWKIRHVERAGKAELTQLLGGGESPALLFTFAHGLSFPSGHPDQADYQGAILCQDWPGRRKHKGPIRRDHYFAAADVSKDARFHGLIAFVLGCYSAGAPVVDNYPSEKAMVNPRDRAPAPFVSALAKKLLSHPNGGALAVVGHVDRIWSRTFGSGVGKGYYHIGSCLQDVLDGRPIGSAMDWMNERFAEISTELSDLLDERKDPSEVAGAEPLDLRRLAAVWRANNDARNFVVLGDPAVYLAAGPRLGRDEHASPAGVYSRRSTGEARLREFLARIQQRERVHLDMSPVEILRRARRHQG